MRKFIAIISILTSIFCLHAQTENVIQTTDSTETHKGLTGFIHRVIDYFNDANKVHPERKLDISFIGGPHYSSESGFGLGIVGSGIYYAKRDSLGQPDAKTPPSTVSLKADVTTGQLYKIGAEGYHIFGGDKYRINYDGYFYTFKDKFWGIGYDNAIDDANESVFKRLQAQLKADFVFNFGGRFYVGPLAQFSYVNATRVDRPELFEGQQLRTFTTGIGFTVMYDTRDVPFNAYKGVLLRFDQLFNPRFMGNTYAFSQSVLSTSGYTSVWKGGVLAAMFHADITYGNTPWGLMPTFGGSSRMRGYYEGRYRDKCEMDFTVELRQHVWRRNGIVIWAGAGSVFPRFSAFKWNHVLPNFGVGYRWQFKPRVNVRLDVGVGRGEKGFNFSINEAF